MKTQIIAISVLLMASYALTACGRKMPPKPEEGSEIIYPGTYPKPN